MPPAPDQRGPGLLLGWVYAAVPVGSALIILPMPLIVVALKLIAETLRPHPSLYSCRHADQHRAGAGALGAAMLPVNPIIILTVRLDCSSIPDLSAVGALFNPRRQHCRARRGGARADRLEPHWSAASAAELDVNGAQDVLRGIPLGRADVSALGTFLNFPQMVRKGYDLIFVTARTISRR